MKDYYKILEVDRNATGEEIKKSYRNLMKKYHPDLYKGEDGEQKTRDLNEAYGVLGDVEKRAAYDRSLDGYNEPKEEFNYDNLTEEQKEYIEFLRKRKAFENIVEEELAKITAITEMKSNIELNGLNDSITNEEYYKQVKSLNNETTNYITMLMSLQEESKKMDLYYIEERIESAKTTIVALIKSLPLSLEELKENEKKEKRTARIKNKINEVTADTNYNINEVAKLLIELSQNTINQIDYANFRESYIVVLKSSISDIEKLLELAKNDSMPEVEELAKLKQRCELCIDFMDKDIEVASKKGNSISIIKECESAINDWFQIYRVKIDKISNMLIKYPNSRHYERLFMYAEQIFNEQYKFLYDLYRKRGYSRDMENIALAFCNKKLKELDTFDLAITIEIHDKKDFEETHSTLSLLRKAPCDVKYYQSEAIIPTIGELIDLYRSNYLARRISSITHATSILGTVISGLSVPICYTVSNEAFAVSVGITIGAVASAVTSNIIYKKSDPREDYYKEKIESKQEYKKILNYKKKKK